MKKIILLGAVSFTGYRFYQLFNKKYSIYGTYNNEKGFTNKHKFILLDINNFSKVQTLVKKLNPDIIINCISIGNVDECEKNRVQAQAINVDFIINLTNFLNQFNTHIKLIHFSSNAIYNGETPPYSEQMVADPLNYYGYTKMLADKYIEENYKNYLIIRPITMIGQNEPFQRDNPLSNIINKLYRGESIMLVNDVMVNFLFIDDLVITISSLIDLDFSGSINISSNETLSWYQLGVEICNVLAFPYELLSSCSITDFPNLAPRPLNTSFNNQLVREISGFNPTPLNEIIKMFEVTR